MRLNRIFFASGKIVIVFNFSITGCKNNNYFNLLSVYLTLTKTMCK